VSAEPVEPPEPTQPALSALEEALRRALTTASREQVLSCIAITLPIEVELEPGSGLHGRIQADKALSDKVQKVSVSMPAGMADLIRARTGAGGFSRYVTEAVQERVRLDLLADLSAELESEYGPVDQDQVKQAMREWPDFAEE
jgi:hypothetical protein